MAGEVVKMNTRRNNLNFCRVMVSVVTVTQEKGLGGGVDGYVLKPTRC